MENQKFFLFAALAFVILMIYTAWQDQQQPLQTTAVDSKPSIASVPDSPVASSVQPDIPPAVPKSRTALSEAVPPSPAIAEGQRISVETDRLSVEINTAGGEVSRVALLAYPIEIDKPDQPIQLLDNRMPQYFVAQSGLLASQGTAPDHRALYRAEQTQYRLTEGSDQLKVRMFWTGEDGVNVTKTFTFYRDSYLVDIDFEVQNAGQQHWKGRIYQQFQRTEMARESMFIYTYTGGIVSSSWDPYEKINFSDMATWKPEQSYNTGGWIAMLQHYFLGAWIPSADATSHYYTKSLAEGRYLLGLSGEERGIASGAADKFSTQLYTGPKDQHRLEQIEPNLRLTVDYGVLDMLAKPIFWLMEKIYSFVGNWGVAIIMVTLIIKLIFYPLSAHSYKSMANMRRLSPKLKALKERYGDDRQKMNQAMMDIYKKEKINPLGGCLPILVQIPVFISLYWVLLESVEMRHAPFFLWIDNLSAQDPYYVLPLLMGRKYVYSAKTESTGYGSNPTEDYASIAHYLYHIFCLFSGGSGVVLGGE